MSDVERPAVYRSRQPQLFQLWQLLAKHHHSFEQHCQERFAESHGYFRLVVWDVVQDYLKCSDLREGFARVRYKEETGTVIYRSKMTHGKSRINFRIFAAEEFIATITQHIPREIVPAGALLRLVFQLCSR